MITRTRRIRGRLFRLRYQISLGAVLLLLLGVGHTDPVDESREVVSKTNRQLEQSQQQIDKLHDATTSMLDQYKTTLRESKTYTTYNRQLGEIVKSQVEELASLNNQITEIEVTRKQIMPLMERMIAALDKFIDQDMPFLPEERAKRVAGLQENMFRADLSVAEKYRKILEAYQIEIEYGNTIEAYTGEIGGRKVNFLKLGRIGFYYQTLDKSECAAWDKRQQAWQTIDDSEIKDSLDLGIKIARKQHSPELLTISAATMEASK